MVIEYTCAREHESEAPPWQMLRVDLRRAISLPAFIGAVRTALTLARLRQLEHQQQSVLHGAQFLACQASGQLTECACVDGSDHLTEDLCWLVVDRDFWVEAGCEGGARRRADDHGGEGEQIVGLDDHRVASALLNVAALAGKLDSVDITTDHVASP